MADSGALRRAPRPPMALSAAPLSGFALPLRVVGMGTDMEVNMGANLTALAAAGLAYYLLGAIWFTPLFGRQWDRAVGFERPKRWRPAAPYYLVPLLGCLVTAAALAALMQLAHCRSLAEALAVGLALGLGYATLTGTLAVSPNMPRPALYALVTGSYHLVGALLCAAVLWFVAPR